MTLLKSAFKRKSFEIDGQVNESKHPNELKKVLTVRDLTFMGVAAVIGAGIFSTIGSAAASGGSGVVFLFIITAITCGLTALCYAEFASRVPVGGSAYSYAYYSFGELVAWLIGWSLILEYSIGNIVVAISWSAYFNNLLHAANIFLPEWLTVGYQSAKYVFEQATLHGTDNSSMVYATAPRIAGIPVILNLPAFSIVVFVTLLAYIGISESKHTTNFMVFLKLFVLIVIAVVGSWVLFTKQGFDNWSPFLPEGMSGVLMGVSSVFFAYIGFDAISTTAEECANPKRDLPRAMMFSLLICTVIYVVITLVITGLVHYKVFGSVTDPLAFVFEQINMPKLGFFISVAAVIASTSVLLVFQIGQPRIWMNMSRDGLLPKKFAVINKNLTPGFATIATGLLVGIPTLFVDERLMTDLTSIGTLFAFAVVCVGVLLLVKNTKPTGFRLPYINGRWIVPAIVVCFLYFYSDRFLQLLVNFESLKTQDVLIVAFVLTATITAIIAYVQKLSLIPVLGFLSCLYLLIEIPVRSWFYFLCWMAIGLSIYFFYGYRKSKLRQQQ